MAMGCGLSSSLVAIIAAHLEGIAYFEVHTLAGAAIIRFKPAEQGFGGHHT